MRPAGGFIRTFVVVIAAMLALGCRSASAAWEVHSLTLPPGTTESTLTSVSCAGEKCWAVGNYRHGGVLSPLAYEAYPGGYELPPTPGNSPELLDISCAPTGGVCMAVGRFVNSESRPQAFAEKWTSFTGWSLQTMTFPTGNTASELGSVSCPTSTECMAVGDYHNSLGLQYLAERWSGGSWTPETPAEPTGAGDQAITAISCPAAGECFATGSYELSPYGPSHQTMEGENFHSTHTSPWSYQGASFKPSSGTGAVMSATSCTSSTVCVSVGSYTNTSSAVEMMAWEKIAALPGWSRQTLAGLASETVLQGIQCWTSTPTCLAVGWRQQSGVVTPLMEQLSGTTWSQVTVPAVSGSSSSQFHRVACITTATWCSAVGWAIVGGVKTALLERNF